MHKLTHNQSKTCRTGLTIQNPFHQIAATTCGRIEKKARKPIGKDHTDGQLRLSGRSNSWLDDSMKDNVV